MNEYICGKTINIQRGKHNNFINPLLIHDSDASYEAGYIESANTFIQILERQISRIYYKSTKNKKFSDIERAYLHERFNALHEMHKANPSLSLTLLDFFNEVQNNLPLDDTFKDALIETIKSLI